MTEELKSTEKEPGVKKEPEVKKDLEIKPPIVIKVQKEPGSAERVEIGLREIDEPVYKALRTFFNKDMLYEAVAVWIGSCYIGGAPKEEIIGNFRRQQACIPLLLELMQPLEAEIKKN